MSTNIVSQLLDRLLLSASFDFNYSVFVENIRLLYECVCMHILSTSWHFYFLTLNHTLILFIFLQLIHSRSSQWLHLDIISNGRVVFSQLIWCYGSQTKSGISNLTVGYLLAIILNVRLHHTANEWDML